MNSVRKLGLRREAITDLTTGELQVVAGASGVTCPACPTVHYECPSNPVTGCTILQETRDCLDTVTCPTDIC